MKPKKMQPRVMWAAVNKETGEQFEHSPFKSRAEARFYRTAWNLKKAYRVVRVRVTEAP